MGPGFPRPWLSRWCRTSAVRLHLHAIFLLSSWGRWTDILSHGRYKRQLTEHDVETICRAVLVYCLNHYRGDENIKSFIWDLITPTADGQTRALLNHSGRSVLRSLCCRATKGYRKRHHSVKGSGTDSCFPTYTLRYLPLTL